MHTTHALASYASNPAQSKGRLFNTSDSPTRSEYQRDRDRIIHSNAFRRLKHKTQVFLHHEGNHFRTRLTHSLEVSQIARSIARSLHLNEDLAEAIALSHDLGHTPFGHAGERVLHNKMKNVGGFDHNLQALRVVTSLENRYAEHDGLNLTWETLEGIVKHNGPLVGGANQSADTPNSIQAYFGGTKQLAAQELRFDSFASLEAQAAAIADDIAYDAHDIDDGLRAGVLCLDQLKGVELIGEIVDEVQAKYPDVNNDRQAHEAVRRLITRLIENVIFQSKQSILDLDPSCPEDIRNASKTLISFSPSMAKQEKALKKFLFAKVYRSPSIMEAVDKGELVVSGVFDRFLEENTMPDEWEYMVKRGGPDGRARVVCDFVSGMTDPYATATYNRMFDAEVDFR